MLIGYQLRNYFSLSASFAVLGLKSSCKIEDVKRKYFELAKKYHPDVNTVDQNAQSKFTEITKVN